jgi:hypothetical protein
MPAINKDEKNVNNIITPYRLPQNALSGTVVQTP